MEIGFIGLGIMGAPMAGRLVEAGHRLHVHTRSRVPESLAGKAQVCPDAAAVAKAAEVIFIMVPDTPDVERVLFGAGGVATGLEGAGAGKTVVDMSSISPLATKDFAARIEALGADYVDAPVSGGEVGAVAGTLSIMCGGREAVFDRVLPLFQILGRNITLVGDSGAGQTAKVANQIIVALNIAAVGEALLFASRAGADPERVRQALSGGFAGSKVLEVHGERMVKRRFEPGFRIRLHRKDLGLALEGAQALKLALPHTASAAQLMQACAALGLEDADHSALVQALEALAHAQVA